MCAAKELTLKKDEAMDYFGVDKEVLDKLVSKKDLYQNPRGDYIYPYDDNPAMSHSLDQLSNDEFRVMNNGKLLEVMERSQVYREAHEGAILINKGETYQVDSVNLASHFVNVSKNTVDYHTMVLNKVHINIEKKLSKTKYGNLKIHFGELTVEEDYYRYKKMHFSKVIGQFNLDLPPLKFRTKGLWFTVPREVKNNLEDLYKGEEEVFEGGLHGAEHALIGLFPLHVMCDRFDIGGLSTNYHEDTQEATIFIYDAYEGGIGITQKAVDVFVDLLKSTRDLLKNCNCHDGCPSCIYSPKCGNDNKPLHKKATEYILNYMCNLISQNPEETAIEKVEKNEIEEVSTNDITLETLYEEAYDLYSQGDYFNSKESLNELVEIDDEYADAWALFGRILYEQGDRNGAKMFTKRALKIDSANEDANELWLELK